MAKKPDKSVKPKDRPTKQAQPTTSTQAQNDDSKANGIWKDERFQHLLADPRFRGVPKVQRKVKIDKRFQGMFNDDKFKVKYTVDKYGRPVNKSNAEDLRKFYELDENDSSDDDEVEKKAKDSSEDEERRAEELAIARDEQANDALKLDSDDGSEVPENLRERLTNPNIDYARGEGRLVTDSSSDEESSDEDGEGGPELQIDHVWGELDIDAECTEESTRRLAVCNMDWDRIRAQDLMVLLSSFLPPGGSVLSVKIYPSEYGKARMAEEDVHGPTELVSAPPEGDSEDSDEELVREQDSDAEEGDDYHMEKLRQYQLNRLRYYYAVIECDSTATADKVYKECDGIEYESSATRVDLRFIPDDTSFDEDMPTDECFELPDASSYKPRQFTTTALQQAKVDLTWDETALDRRELGDKLSSGKVDQLNDKELRQIVAYSSEEDDDEEEQGEENDDGEELKNKTKQEDAVEPTAVAAAKQPAKRLKQNERIEKYKNLLAEINAQEKQAKEKDYEMEMSWNIDAPEASVAKDIASSSSKSQLTPIEQVLQKRSEKNKLRKEQRRRKQLELQGIDPDATQNSDDESIPDGIDMNDSYFAEEFASGDYEHPKLPNKSKSKKEKHKKTTPDDAEEEAQKEAQLALLLDDEDGMDQQPKQHFSLAKILKEEQTSSSSNKRKRRKQLKKSKNSVDKPQNDDNFQVDLDDTRFKAVYKSHEYNIDPTHSNYKATKGMQQLINEKLKRRQQQQLEQPEDDQPTKKRSKQQLEQNALVKSLKMKIQQRKA